MRRTRLTALGTLALALLAAPLAAGAQQPGKVYRLGFVGSATADAGAHLVEAFRQGMRDLGWIEGQHYVVEYRWAAGKLERLPEFAAELVRLKVDLFVAGADPQAEAIRRATTTIPLVMVAYNPVSSKLVQSLARPGGNVTGLARDVTPETFAKNLELLKEIAPRTSRVTLLWPASPGGRSHWLATSSVARTLGVTLQRAEIRSLAEVEAGVATLGGTRGGGLMVFANPVTFAAREQITALVARHGLPAIYPSREYIEAGGLLSYGASYAALLRRAAFYVDRILRGGNPADLPVEQPTKFELVVNLKTAKALRLTIPPSVLARADEVIQ